jgi:pyrroline-5-carboxylate reductase
MRLGIIGAGNLAAAMARGWSGAEGGPDEIVLTDSGSGRAERLAAEVGGSFVAGNAELGESADVIVFAFKPAGLDQVAPEVADAGKPVISALGATSLEQLAGLLPGVPVVRTMPNIAVELRRGVICWSASEEVDPALRERLLALLKMLGTTIELEDRLIDPATAVMGCSPAYLALVAEALTEAGVAEGLSEDAAREMVTETLAGTAELLDQRHTLDLRRAVASPGGSTEAGLEALESGSLRETLEAAVSASLERMRG